MPEIKIGQRFYGIGFGNEHVRSKSLADQPVYVVEVLKVGRVWAHCAEVYESGARGHMSKRMDIDTLKIHSFNGHFQMFSSREELQQFKNDLIFREKCQNAFGMNGVRGVDKLTPPQAKKLYECLVEVGLIQTEEI